MEKIYKYIIIISYVFIYVVPLRGNLHEKFIYIYYLLLIIASIIIIIKKNILDRYELFLFFCLLILISFKFYLTKDIEGINIFFTLFISLFISKVKYNITKRNFEKLTYLALVAIFCQMMVFRNLGRPVLSVLDPNYSGFYIFLIFISLDFMKSKLRYLCLCLGFLTFSRNFILAILIYYFIKKIKIKNLLEKIKLNNFYILAIISSYLIIIFSYYFVNNIKIESKEYSLSRVYQFNDSSNLSRFRANIVFIDALKSDKKFFLLGEKDIEEYKVKFYRNVPHNNFFEGIRRYGVPLYFIMFILIGRIYNKIINYKNLGVLLSVFLYYIFLGGLTYGYRLVFFIGIFKYIGLQNQDKES